MNERQGFNFSFGESVLYKSLNDINTSTSGTSEEKWHFSEGIGKLFFEESPALQTRNLLKCRLYRFSVERHMNKLYLRTPIAVSLNFDPRTKGYVTKTDDSDLYLVFIHSRKQA
jgi:hypothetical protein